MYKVLQTKKFVKWMSKLKDMIAKVSIVRRIEQIKLGNFGNSKFIGDSVFELRIDVGQGYRVYFKNKENEIIVLLVGGDKSTQEKDIETAKKLAKEV